ncbi:MAG: hypothetical protein GY851_19755 [bacterium]|nr:hypothetical protein [bacterium]
MKPAVVAVLDVGKTNKKLSAYGEAYEVLAEHRASPEPGEANGLEVEATEELLSWFRGALKDLAADYDVQAVAITTHGATCALIGEDGGLAHPVISYTSEKGGEVQDAFYAAFGDRDALHKVTCTPDLGFANMAKSLFYVKERLPEVWERCRHVLFYSGYLGYELTGNMGIEYTYLGNHSYFWNYAENTWSTVAKGLGVDTMFPDTMTPPWKRLGTLKPEIAEACGVGPECQVTMGIHDSNANFLPYLAKGYQNFILNSTGTWCVGMRQSDTCELTDAEREAKVLYNLDAFGRPLKTSIFPGGMEYETFGAFTDAKDASDLDAVKSVVAGKSLFVVPGVLPDATAFPGATARVVNCDDIRTLKDLESAGGTPFSALGQDYYAALNLSLAIATRQMLNRCGAEKGTTVFVEGGFANNTAYCALLAALCPDCTIALTNMKEGTSFGAAITGWMAARDQSELDAMGDGFSIETVPVAPCDVGDLDSYCAAFEALLDR